MIISTFIYFMEWKGQVSQVAIKRQVGIDLYNDVDSWGKEKSLHLDHISFL